MFNRIVLSVVLVFVFSATGCSLRRDPVQDSTIKWDKIERVFMHQPHEYSFLLEVEPGKPELKTVVIINYKEEGYSWLGDVKIFADADKDKPMWAEAKVGKFRDKEFYYNLCIHIHNPKDIGGGDWQHRERKAVNRGKINVIE